MRPRIKGQQHSDDHRADARCAQQEGEALFVAAENIDGETGHQVEMGAEEQ